MNQNEKFMRLALKEGEKAKLKGEVPIGCVIVKDNKVLVRAHNNKESKMDATKHAEMIAIQKASKKLKDWRLIDCDIYVTLEPCPMCAGAISNSRIRKVYFGAYDTVSGCAGTVYNLCDSPTFYHKTEVEGGVLEDECSQFIKNFFKERRLEKSNLKNALKWA